jgi:hypothetical protein
MNSRVFPLFLFSLLITFLLIFTSCKKDNDDPETATIQIDMFHHVNNDLLKFNELIYENEFGNQYSVSRLQYFVSDFELVHEDGRTFKIDTAFYVDGLVPETQSLETNLQIPYGSYSTIRFTFGLNAARNINGAYPNPPENNMEWPIPLGGGYHYMKLEGKVAAGEVQNNFQAHTGPTNGNQNFIEVSLDGSFFLVDSPQELLIIGMDINNWWKNPNLLDLNEITMVMGNQAIQEKLKANGTDVFRVEPLIEIQ